MKNDIYAIATIWLSPSDDYLERIKDVDMAYDMWVAVKIIFQRRTLLNRFNAR